MQKPRLKGFSWALKAKYCKTSLCYLLYLASVFSFLALGLNSTVAQKPLIIFNQNGNIMSPEYKIVHAEWLEAKVWPI
jgi:hypothetical protein